MNILINHVGEDIKSLPIKFTEDTQIRELINNEDSRSLIQADANRLLRKM